MARTKGDLGYALGRFRSIGLSREAGIGILSSLAGESGRGLDTQAYNPKDPEGGAFGIAQWVGKRRKALQAYARAAGKDYRDFRTQVDFIAHELVGNKKVAGGSSEVGAYNRLRGVTDPYQAQAIWTKYYERPAQAELRARQRMHHVDYFTRVTSGVQGSGDMTQMAQKTTTTRRRVPGILDTMFNAIGGGMTKFGEDGEGVTFPTIDGKGTPVRGGSGTDTLVGGTGSGIQTGIDAGNGILGIGQGLGGPGGLIGSIAGGLLGGPAGTLVGGLLGNSITNLLQRIGDEQTAVLGGEEEEVVTTEDDEPPSKYLGIDDALKNVARYMGRSSPSTGSEMGGNHGADFNKGERFVESFYATLAKDPKKADEMAARSPYGGFVRNNASGANANVSGRGSIERE